MARLFFVQPEEVQGQFIRFSERAAKHLHSLRKTTGDEIQVILHTPSIKKEYRVRLSEHHPTYVGEIIEESDLILPDEPKIHILQCIPKLDKMDLIIQKVSELGGYEIVPLFSRFTDIQGQIGEKKLTRWQHIAEESSIQSGRKDLILIHPPLDIAQYFESIRENLSHSSSIGIILNERESEKHLHDIAEKLTQEQTDIYVLIGAEGGFSEEEITEAKNIGFLSVSLGDRILRTETAPIAITAVLQYILKGF